MNKYDYDMIRELEALFPCYIALVQLGTPGITERIWDRIKQLHDWGYLNDGYENKPRKTPEEMNKEDLK